MVLGPALVILLLDQITKYWIRSSLPLYESLPVLSEDFFRLTHVENTGVAFGLKAGSMLFLSAFNALASILLIYYLLKHPFETTSRYPRFQRFSLALILGGALGNLMDRAFRGHVTDFLDFDFPDFIMTRWPVFNVADSAVTVGVTLWAIHLVFFTKPANTAPTNSTKNLP